MDIGAILGNILPLFRVFYLGPFLTKKWSKKAKKRQKTPFLDKKLRHWIRSFEKPQYHHFMRYISFHAIFDKKI